MRISDWSSDVFSSDLLKLFGLVDHSSEFLMSEDTVTLWKTWYGAYYYKLIPVRSARDDYYVLLGWNSNGPGLSGRVIEALHFKNGAPHFGLPVFESPEGIRNRVVFRYSSKASMMLDYLPEKKTIVFDHLVQIGRESCRERVGQYV